MKRLTALLLLVALSGCLSPAGGPAPAEPRTDGNPATPTIPAEPARPAGPPTPGLLEPFGFEGAGCTQHIYGGLIPTSRIAPYIPPPLVPSNAVSITLGTLFVCTSATLADGSFQEGVNLLFYAVQVADEDEPIFTYYVMEAVTDWPDLRDALARHGMPAHTAGFGTSAAPAGLQHAVRGEGRSYDLHAPTYAPEAWQSSSDSHVRLLAGPEGATVFGMQVVRTSGDKAYQPAFVIAEGGVMGAATDGAWPFTVISSSVTPSITT